MIIDLKTETDVDVMLKASSKDFIMLFKHSTRCPVSSYAWSEFNQFAGNSPISCYRVLVVEEKTLSLHLAKVLGVTHQSPQAILFKDKEVKWHASHYDITQSALEKATGFLD